MLKLLTIELILILVYLLYRLGKRHVLFNAKDRFIKNIYKLFAVRDKLIWLAVQNPEIENDEIFRLLYKRINLSLNQFEDVNRLHLSTIEKFASSISIDTEIEIEDLFEKIENHSSTELKGCIKDFNNIIMNIVFVNSLFYILFKYIIPHFSKFIPKAIKQFWPIAKLRTTFQTISNIDKVTTALTC